MTYILYKILQELCIQLGMPLSILFNKSIEKWKLSARLEKCSGIFKKGTKSVPGNYRPVSLTCVLCKVLKSIIREVMVNHMIESNLYRDCQHGFRKGRSCTTQLLQVMEDFTYLIDNSQPIDVIYLDFQKAFDQVSHQRLLYKLNSYGITVNILNWLRDFLYVQ